MSYSTNSSSAVLAEKWSRQLRILPGIGMSISGPVQHRMSSFDKGILNFHTRQVSSVWGRKIEFGMQLASLLVMSEVPITILLFSS